MMWLPFWRKTRTVRLSRRLVKLCTDEIRLRHCITSGCHAATNRLDDQRDYILPVTHTLVKVALKVNPTHTGTEDYAV